MENLGREEAAWRQAETRLMNPEAKGHQAFLGKPAGVGSRKYSLLLAVKGANALTLESVL